MQLGVWNTLLDQVPVSGCQKQSISMAQAFSLKMSLISKASYCKYPSRDIWFINIKDLAWHYMSVIKLGGIFLVKLSSS